MSNIMGSGKARKVTKESQQLKANSQELMYQSVTDVVAEPAAPCVKNSQLFGIAPVGKKQ